MASLETRCEFRSSKLHRTLPGEQRQPLYAPTRSGETDRRELTPSRSTLPSHRLASQKFWRRISSLQLL